MNHKVFSVRSASYYIETALLISRQYILSRCFSSCKFYLFLYTLHYFSPARTISVCTRYVHVCVSKDVEKGWQLEGKCVSRPGIRLDKESVCEWERTEVRQTFLELLGDARGCSEGLQSCLQMFLIRVLVIHYSQTAGLLTILAHTHTCTTKPKTLIDPPKGNSSSQG